MTRNKMVKVVKLRHWPSVSAEGERTVEQDDGALGSCLYVRHHALEVQAHRLRVKVPVTGFREHGLGLQAQDLISGLPQEQKLRIRYQPNERRPGLIHVYLHWMIPSYKAEVLDVRSVTGCWNGSLCLHHLP